MMEKNSKEHEVKVLESVFTDSKYVFDNLGYSGYTFESKDGEGVPDGIFYKGSSLIWIEHTQARLNYGKKGSVLLGFDGFCIDVRRELVKEEKNGCLCFDIPSSLTDLYFSSSEIKSKMLSIARWVIESSNEFADDEHNIYAKYCSPEACCLDNLNDYKGLRVIVSQWHNIDFCRVIPRTVYDECLSIKEQKYRANISPRNENWLFIEEPWGYSFKNDLPDISEYYDRVFIVSRDGKMGNECYVPRIVACKKKL